MILLDGKKVLSNSIKSFKYSSVFNKDKLAHEFKCEESNKDLSSLLRPLTLRRKEFRELTQLEIIDSLNKSFELQSEELKNLNLFSNDDFRILSQLFNKRNLESKVISELESLHSMESPKRSHRGNYLKSRAPLGVIFNVSASNVLLGVVDNFINLMLTKNVSIIKVSQENYQKTLLFFEYLLKNSMLKKFCAFIVFRGGEILVENEIAALSDAIVLWGGDELIKSYARFYPKKMIHHGPRLSFSVLDLKNDYSLSGLLKDFTQWSQKACSNSQVLYLVSSSNEDVKSFILKLKEFFDNHDNSHTLAISHDANGDEQVEILKHLEVAKFNKFETSVDYLYAPNRHLVYFSQNNQLEASPLNNTLIIKRIENIRDIIEVTRSYKDYLQSVSTNFSGNERRELFSLLSTAGVHRLTDIGGITESRLGTPHEGDFSLRELTRLFVDETTHDSHTFQAHSHEDEAHSFEKYEDYGIVYASGGTTGRPKFKQYTYGEINYISHKLALSYTDLLRIKPRPLIANLFVAGNMWSSFNVVQRALEVLALPQLPIGGSLDESELSFFLSVHRPSVIFGIPSFIAKFASYLKREGKKLSLTHIFFAGEKITKKHKELFDEVFSRPDIRSAGYATVDLGLIGFQFNDNVSEFKLFNDVDYLMEESSQLLVRPFGEKSYLPTGDLVEKIGDRAFKLIGRVDKTLSIWGARISLDMLQSLFPNCWFEVSFLTHEEVLTVYTKSSYNLDECEKNFNSLLTKFYNDSHDLKSTVTLDFFKSHCHLKVRDQKQNPRTGKLMAFIDMRD